MIKRTWYYRNSHQLGLYANPADRRACLRKCKQTAQRSLYSTNTWAQTSLCHRRIRLFSQCTPKTMNAVGLYLLLSSLFLYYALRELTYSNDFRDKQEVLKSMVGARGPYVPSTG